MAKKKFTVNTGISKGFKDAAEHARGQTSKYENQTVLLDKIIIDETNPRSLKVEASEIIRVLKGSSIEKRSNTESGLNDAIDIIKKEIVINKVSETEKLKELASLKELALGILKNGLMHPVVVYKNNDIYKLVAGERRYLAHLLLCEEYIETRTLIKQPNGLTKKVTQWVENFQRDDLTPFGKVLNVQQLLNEYKESSDVKADITPSILADIGCIPKSSASYYLQAARAPKDVLEALERGDISSVRKAAAIAGENDIEKRKHMIEASKKGASSSWLKNISKEKQKNISQKGLVGRKAKKINLGSTENPKVVKKITSAVIKHCNLAHLEKDRTEIDWSDFKKVSKLFNKVINELEALKK